MFFLKSNRNILDHNRRNFIVISLTCEHSSNFLFCYIVIVLNLSNFSKYWAFSKYRNFLKYLVLIDIGERFRRTQRFGTKVYENVLSFLYVLSLVESEASRERPTSSLSVKLEIFVGTFGVLLVRKILAYQNVVSLFLGSIWPHNAGKFRREKL